MTLTVGETYRDEFYTYDGTTLADADSTPTGTLVVNGTDNGASVTVSNAATGRYKVSVSTAGLSVNDLIYVRVSATVGGVTEEKRLQVARMDVAVNTRSSHTAADAAAAVHNADYSGLFTADKFGAVIQQMALDASATVADTNELQTDWTNGGRLDLIVDAILADTNELQTDWANGGRLDALLDATLADTNELQSDWANGGRLDLILDDILTDTAALPAFPSNFASLAITVGGAVTVGTLPTIPTGWITANGIASEAITSAKFAANAITEDAIDTAAFTTAKFDTAFLTAGLIAASALDGKGDWNTVAPDNSTISTINTKLGTPVASVSTDIAAVKSDTGTLVSRITANLFSGITYLGRWLGVIAGKTADSTTLAEINATTGGTSYDNTTDSLQAIKDAGVSVDVDESAIATAVVNQLGGTNIEVKSPVLAGGDLELMAGDAYDLEIPITGWTGDNLDGATVTLRLISIADYKASGTSATPEMEVTGLAAQAGSTVTCSWTLSTTNTNTATQTSVYPVQQTRTHRYTIRVDADDLTVAEGRAVVRANPT